MRAFNDDIYLCNDGGDVLVEHSILNLEGESPLHLNFISSAAPVYGQKKLHGKQLLVSEECYRILVKRFPKAPFLVCQYFRPITLGHVTVELLPSGRCPGSSFLRIEKRGESIFYASHWSRRASTAVRKAAFKKANTLLLKLQADPLNIMATNSKRETDRFLEYAEKITGAGESLVAVVDAFGEAQDLACRLFESRIRVSCDPKTYGLMKTINECLPPMNSPSWFNSLRKATPGPAPMPGVILVSKEYLLHQRMKVLPKGIWVWIGLDKPALAPVPWLSHISFGDTFLIQNSPDIAEISDLIREVSPQHILMFGEGAKNCVHHFVKQGMHAELFAPPKVETLF